MPTAAPLLRAVHVAPLSGVPEWVEMIPAGEFSGRDGRGPYRLDAEAVLAAFAAIGMPVAIDYEHQTFAAAENGQPAPAAGWVRAIELRDGAVWGRVEWTERAAAMVAAREYLYLSPVFEHTQGGAVMALVGAGLTNHPNLYLTAFHRALSASPEGVTPMEDMLERLRYMLNLPTLATQEEIAAELDKFLAQLKAPATAAMRQTLGVEGGLGELITAAQGKLAGWPDLSAHVPRAQYDAVAGELAALKTEQAAHRVDTAIATAVQEGKLLPAQSDWARAYCRQDMDGFGLWCATAPVVAPLGEIATHARVAGESATEVDAVTYPEGCDPARVEQDRRIRAHMKAQNCDYPTAAHAVLTTHQTIPA